MKETQMEMELARAGMIVHPDPTIMMNKRFKKGAFDAVIKLDVEENECLSRALARREDPEGHVMYNLLEMRPPTN